MIKKSKKPSLLLTLGTAVLLAGGGGAAYWYLTQRGLGPGELPVGAEVIPQDALMAISLSTNAEQWEKLREFGTPQSQAVFDQNLAQLRDRILTANGFDYEKDIKPWIGKEMTVAFLAPQTTSPSSPSTPPAPRQQATVMVLPIQDPLQAKQILEKPRPQTAGKLVDRTYKGFQIKETQGTPAQSFSATVLDGKLLMVTDNPKATDRAIDTYKDGNTLASTPGYTQALSKIQVAQPFGKLYVNIPAAVGVTATNSQRLIPPQSLAQVQQTQGFATTVSLGSDGVQFKGITWLKPDSQRKNEVKNSAKSMPERLPADTLLMASGGNLKQVWQSYSQGAAANPAAPINPEGLRTGLRSTINMDLDKDFIAWMDGEFSLSLIAPEGNASGPPSFLFMVQSNDRRAAEAAFKQLDQAMASKYKFRVEDSKIGNQPVTNWSLPAGGATITHGWLDRDVAFLTLGAPVANTIIPKPTASLADSEPFKAGVPSELRPNNGHFFANSKGLLLLQQLLPVNQDLFAAIRSIGVTTAVQDERSTRYDALVALQKAGKPGPLPSPKLPSGASASPGVGSPAPLPTVTPSP